MGVDNRMQAQGGCPSGAVGRFFGFLMNNIHKGIYGFGLEFINIKATDYVLDIGCGGGQMLKLLSKHAGRGRVFGIDHSEQMVDMAAKKNKNNPLVDVRQASVSELPFGDEEFRIVTAIETIQFWPDIDNDLKEVLRVLQPGGSFLVVNRYPKEDSSWTEFLTFKSKQAYVTALQEAGFKNVIADTKSRQNWIRITAIK